jgi:alkylation response protein AidB-like acyl-CoA dehydrogenase
MKASGASTSLIASSILRRDPQQRGCSQLRIQLPNAYSTLLQVTKVPDSGAAFGLADYRAQLHAWLDAHHRELAPRFTPPGTLDDRVAQMQRVKSILFDAGWMQFGWPERVGGRGGSPMLRTELGAAIAGRDLADPGLFSLVEVLAPTLIDFAPPELAAEVVPRLLAGAELWCQGFSEPESGSDLASLRCRAVPDGGDARTASKWIIDGQKVWTSLAQFSQRCALLTRTGPADSRHRGITAFFVDMDTPGISVRPIEMINGEQEFAEVFFDGVVVPADRMLGEPGGGWAVAMSILPYERSSCFWQRVAYLYARLERLVRAVPPDDRAAEVVGNAYVELFALRARSRATQHRLAETGTLGAETSIDKVLVASTEQTVYDAVRRLLSGTVETNDGAAGETWRKEYLYSRAATIYGGSAEVQRNIIARRLLELGDEA